MPQCSVAELASTPKATLLILHGLAEHAGRYRTIARTFASRGISTFAFDQHGHGGRCPKTHVDRFDRFVDEAAAALAQIDAEHSNLPRFVWGHSMGSMVAVLLAARAGEQLAGLVITSNSLDVFTHRRLHPLRAPFRSLARIAPRTPIPLTLDPAQISHDDAVQRAYTRDPLISRTASLQLLIEFALVCKRAEVEAPSIRVPMLIAHGAADTIAPVSGAQRLHAALGASDKTLQIIPELRHELQNEREPERTRFLDSLAEWVLARASAHA